ncbi:M67 family metallopeptidase [Paenibacillus jiagnxiensis]|uniref:M67 family metallopeptidase n=1 Tax=Paenibacillus jiagnxiensis TaxID=3228926 RepID=UPI0033BF0ED1
MINSSVHIPSVLLDRLERYVRSCQPKEACGALLGHIEEEQLHISEFIPIPNTAVDPYHHFEFDGPAWVNCVMRETALIGIFHSHPTSSPVPSEEDLQHLQLFGAGLTAYLITGAGNPSGFMFTVAYLVASGTAPPSLLTLELVPLRVT